MKTYRRWLFIVLIATFLNACQSIYVPPTNSPKAYLGVLNNDFLKRDTLGIFGDPVNCQNGYMLGDFASRLAADDRLYTIEANKMTTISLNHITNATTQAQFIITFYPKAGQYYYLTTKDNFFYGTNVTLVRKSVGANGQTQYLFVPFIKRRPALMSGCSDTAI